jgi:hypothetical protein
MALEIPPYRDDTLPPRFQIWLEQQRQKLQDADSSLIRAGSHTPIWWTVPTGDFDTVGNYNTNLGLWVRMGNYVITYNSIACALAGPYPAFVGNLEINGLPFKQAYIGSWAGLALGADSILWGAAWPSYFFPFPVNRCQMYRMVNGIRTTPINAATDLFGVVTSSFEVAYWTNDPLPAESVSDLSA